MAMFSQRHYEAIAKTLKPLQIQSNVDCVNEATWALVEMFEQDNERFDREKFLRAAGVK